MNDKTAHGLKILAAVIGSVLLMPLYILFLLYKQD